MTIQITEGLNYKDMEGQVTPIFDIDQFKSQIGEDSDIIVLNFIVSGKDVGDDLVAWFERGYDWIIDADVSPGEVLDKKFYVFAEMNRTSTAPRRIMELLDDLHTLTDIKKDDWKVKIGDNKYPATEENISELVPCSAAKYKEKNESELNEWRQIAGLPTVTVHQSDKELIAWKRRAGIM
jgi:hypothetical protein